MGHWKERSRAAGIHLAASVLVALLAAALVFIIWYPYPYREASGGRELFTLVVVIDVIIGPLLTFAVFNRKKPIRELRRDLFIVVLLQLAALGYGLWTVYAARPVHLVFEIDRFQTVHAIEVDPELLQKAPPGFRSTPLLGPTLLAVRPFKNANESGEATMVALSGVSMSSRPDLWEEYAAAKPRVRTVAKPAATLLTHFPAQAPLIDKAVQDAGRPVAKLVYVPMKSRMQFWTVLLDAQTMDVVGFINLDSF